MTLTKAEIVDTLVQDEEIDLSPQEAKAFVDAFFEQIARALEAGDDVKFSGFGNFTLHEKRPRPGRNPKTGESVMIDQRRVVTFKAGQKMKGVIQRALSTRE